jgi:hypothetical protein
MLRGYPGHKHGNRLAVREDEVMSEAEFADRMLRTMNEASVALMVSVGHRTGLFDVMAAMPAATIVDCFPSTRTSSRQCDSRVTSGPLAPRRKSRSAPVSACST